MLTFHSDVNVLQTLEAQPGWRVLSAWDWWPTAELGTKLDGVEEDVEFRDEPLIFWVTLRNDGYEPGVARGRVSIAPVTVSSSGDVGTLYNLRVEYVLVREGADLAEHKNILLGKVRSQRKAANRRNVQGVR